MKYILISILTIIFVVSCVNQATGQVTRSFSEPVELRHVAATQPDVVSKLLVRKGSSVNVGDVIAEMDNSVLRKNLQIAQLRANSDSEIRAAEAKIEIARNRVEQLKPMLEKGHANPAEVEKAESDFESAAADLELAREKQKEFELEAERIKAEIERNIIRSPISGVVTEIHCRPGEFISSNERKLATVVRLKRLRVRFFLFEQAIEQLTVDQEVEIDYGSQRTKVVGTVEFVSPVIDPESGTSRVDVLIDNRDGALRSGSVCYWSVQDSEDPEAVSANRPHGDKNPVNQERDRNGQ